MTKKWDGVMKVDVRDSTPDWGPYIPEKPPEGAPNVLIVLYDDTGVAAWSPFGASSATATDQNCSGRLMPASAVRSAVSARSRSAGVWAASRVAG